MQIPAGKFYDLVWRTEKKENKTRKDKSSCFTAMGYHGIFTGVRTKNYKRWGHFSSKVFLGLLYQAHVLKA